MRGHCNYSSGEEGGHERCGKGHCHNDGCERGFGPWAPLMRMSQDFGPPHHGHHFHGPHFHGPHFHGPHAFGPHGHHHGPHHHGHHHGPHRLRHHRGPFGRGPWHHHHGGPFSGPFGPCGRSETFGACGRTVTFGPCGRSGPCQSEGQCCNNEERNRCKQTKKKKPSTSQDKDGNAETVLVQRIVVEHPSRSVSV